MEEYNITIYKFKPEANSTKLKHHLCKAAHPLSNFRIQTCLRHLHIHLQTKSQTKHKKHKSMKCKIVSALVVSTIIF